MRLIALCAAILAFVFSSTTIWASGKVALVIGNGQYVNANKLPNPPRDAAAMLETLEGLGFRVISGTDLSFAGMGQKIGEFEEIARDADVTLFFYAGHALQVNGRNYLLPVEATIENESSLQFQTIDSEIILRAMSGPGKNAIALLDACRDNPLSRSLARSLGRTRSTAVQQGLAVPTIAGGGLLIGFATAPGDTAADGDGKNSPFTTALLKNLKTPGLEIQQVMTRVKRDVFVETKQSQEPWHNTSLRDEIYLNGDPNAVAAPVEKSDSPRVSNDLADWNLVKDSNSVAVLDAFIAGHADNALLLALATERKEKLLEANKKVAGVQNEEPLPSLEELEKARRANADADPNSTSIFDSLTIKKTKPEEQVALNDAGKKDIPTRNVLVQNIGEFIKLAGEANKGNTKFALLSVSEVTLKAPLTNPGKKTPALNLAKIASAPAMEALLGAQPDLRYDESKAVSCRADYLDRCPFIPDSFVQALNEAMREQGYDRQEHNNNYFTVNKIPDTDLYAISNSPPYNNGVHAVLVAIVTEQLELRDVFGIDLDASKMKVNPGDKEAYVEMGWVLLEGDDYILSFDTPYRCTETPRKYGFATRIDGTTKKTKWVSPYNVTNYNMAISGDSLFTADGGSCQDDHLYQLNKNTGQVLGRMKLPSQADALVVDGDKLIVKLYDGAAVYQLNSGFKE
jgi:hypothetical protein